MIIFRTHRTQLALLGGASAILSLSGLLSLAKKDAGFRRYSGALGASYFLYHAARLARLAWKPEALILGKEGLLDRAGSPPAGFLPWEHITGAEVLTLPVGPVARKFVGIRLDSADPLKGGRSRPMLEPPLLQGYAALVPEYTLEERVEDIVETLNLYIEDAEERDELESLLYAPGKPSW
jgi:hypothetical protein